MVEVRKVSREEIEKKVEKKGRWIEKVDRQKLLLVLDEILSVVEENTNDAIEFDGKEFLAELGISIENLRATTVNSKINEVIRKVGAEIGKWNKERYKLITRIDGDDVKCFVMLKKKALNE